MTFSHIGSYLPKFSKYLDGADAPACISKMVKKKKGGKELVKFFEKAVKCSEWKSDAVFKSLLDCAVTKSSKLGKKEKSKFKKIEKVYSSKVKGMKAATPAVQQPLIQQPSQTVKKFTFDEASYKILKKTRLTEFSKVINKQFPYNHPCSLDGCFQGMLTSARACALDLGKIIATIYLKSNNKTHFTDDDYSEFRNYVVNEFKTDLLKIIQDYCDYLKQGIMQIAAANPSIQYNTADNRQTLLVKVLPSYISELESDLDKYKIKLQYGLQA